MMMVKMDMNDRVKRLQVMLAEGRIIRGTWVEGHDRACLLAALSPEVARAQRPSACPADVMPLWLAHLTPNMDDCTSIEAWSNIVQRYADLAGRWHVLDTEAWDRVRIASLLAIMREARVHCPPRESEVITAIDAVITWLEAGAPEDERVRVAGTVAETVAARAAAEAAVWAAEATGAWAWEWVAVAAAAAARAAAWAAAVSDEAARAAAWDRISYAVLDAIETECDAAAQHGLIGK